MTQLENLIKDDEVRHLLNEIKKLPEQERIATLRKIYETFYDRLVPDLDTFLFDERYLGLKEKSLYPAIRELLHQIDKPEIREAYLVLGKGSGKSTLTAILQARNLHKLLCYINPQEYFKLMPGSLTALINMSISAPQALNVMFKKFSYFVNQIQDFIQISKRQYVKYKENKNDASYTLKEFANIDEIKNVEMYSETQGVILFPDKSIIALSGHSNAPSFFGYDIFYGSVDEASFFVQPKNRKLDDENLGTVEEVIQGLLASMQSRFPEHYKLLVISTPRSKTDDWLWLQHHKIKNSGLKIEVDI